MIIKKYFNPRKVIRYVNLEMGIALSSSLAASAMHQWSGGSVQVPFSVSAILGSALAIFIGFRNNSSYSRWWEARMLWGGITNACRAGARLIITFADSHALTANYVPERSEQFKREMIYHLIAWVNVLRFHLRRQTSSLEELRPLLSDAAYHGLIPAQNKPNFLLLHAGRKLYTAMADGTLAGFDGFQIEGQLLALGNAQGGCERIKNTPLLRQYHYFTRLFLFSFMVLLPFSFAGDFARLNIFGYLVPISMLISFVFAIMAKLGEVNEDPFENQITDVPMTALCNLIERDLREMLGEPDLPPKAEPENGYLF